MVSIRQKFYKHILENNLKENDEWTIEMQDEFYDTLNGFERAEFNYLIKELIDQKVILLKDGNLLFLTKHGEEKAKSLK